MTRPCRNLGIVGRSSVLVIAVSCFVVGAAEAQYYGTDPYDPYGRGYRSAIYPGAGSGIYVPGVSRFSNSTANQFERLGDEVGGVGLPGDRYDSAYRQYDRDFGREYRPNERADAKYYADRQRREESQIKSMRGTEKRSGKAGSSGRISDSLLSGRRDVSSGAGAAVPRAPSIRGTGRSGTRSATPSAATSGRTTAPTAAAEAIPPAPGLNGRRRETARAAATPTAARSGRSESGGDRSPTEVLDRAKRTDRDRAPLASPRRVPTG
jgi:hypothetical protein